MSGVHQYETIWPRDPRGWQNKYDPLVMREVDKLWKLAEPSHSSELIPWEQVSLWCSGHPWLVGLLALFFGVANWGITPAPALFDPLDKQWKGVARKHGKHFRDGDKHHQYGGVSICHLDGAANYRAMYLEYTGSECPYKPLPPTPLNYFNAIITGEVKNAFVTWNSEVFKLPSWRQWIVHRWLAHYWIPAVEACGGNASTEKMAAAIANARIRNSRSSWGEKCADRPWEQQLEYYLERKAAESKDKVERTFTQCLYVARAVSLLYVGRGAQMSFDNKAVRDRLMRHAADLMR